MLLLLFGWILSGQEDREAHQVAVFVYCNGTINTPTNALRAGLTSSIMNDSSGSYVVLDRSDEILSLLKKEFKYQGDGYVRDDQLVSIGDHLGAHYLCVVDITYYPDDSQYFFECRLVNVRSRQVERQSFYPTGQTVVSSLSPQEQIKVAGALSSIFRLNPKAIKVGDPYRDGSGNPVYVDGSLMRIGYIDETGEHGFSYVVLPIKHDYPYTAESDSLFLRPPYLSEMRLLYGNNDVLGLSGEFWSSDVYDDDFSRYPDHCIGSFNFDTCRESRRSGRDRPKFMKDEEREKGIHHVWGVVTWSVGPDGSRREKKEKPHNPDNLSCINIHPF